MGIREETEKKVFAYIREQGMIAPGDRIVIGVSGGADSVCLLEMLLAYGKEAALELAVVHVNHGLRKEAGEDAGYVEELCRRNNLPFFLTQADVRGVALEEKCSEEDAGRRIRYRAFRQAAGQLGGGKVAVAHNSNDNAETMLFHLFRGSGLKGLSGIAPVRRDQDGLVILRPILCLERQEVEAYLHERGISWCTDSTNEGDGYCRNRIRHHILPYAEQEVSAGAVAHMLQTAMQLQVAESYLKEQTEAALRRCAGDLDAGAETAVAGPAGAAEAGETAGPADAAGAGEMAGPAGKRKSGAAGCQVDVEEFLGFHEALRGRMLLKLITDLSPTGKDISALHVRDVLSLFEKEGNRSVSLPFGIRARRQYGQVVLERAEAGGALKAKRPPEGKRPTESESLGPLPVEVPLTEALFWTPVLADLGDLGKMEFSAFFMHEAGQEKSPLSARLKKTGELPQNQYTKWFDYDKMEERAVIRFRARGDFLTIADRAGKAVHKSVKDYMITEKIPRHFRDRIPLVAFGSHILWLVGFRISESFKVREDTERVLQVKFIKKQGTGTEEKDVGAH